MTLYINDTLKRMIFIDLAQGVPPRLISHLPPPLDVRLGREGAGVGVPVHGEGGVVAPQGLGLGRGATEGHVVS